MAKHHLSIEEHYGLAAIGLCKAGLVYKEDKSKFSTYAYKCMYNEVMSELRKERSMKRIPKHQIVYYDAELETHNDDTASLLKFIPSDDEVENSTLSKVLFEEYSNSLNDRDRQIFVLFREGYKQKQIGEIVGCSQTQISRIKKKLEVYLSS